MKEKLKTGIKSILDRYAYETNDSKTRKSVEDEVFKYLAHERDARNIYSFIAICSEQNNTPDVIDRNELAVDFGFKMSPNDEMTVITAYLGRASGMFDEVL